MARRTGLRPETIRAWERRYGFPRPLRLPKGHRRYTEADVQAIVQAVAARDAGVRLSVALAEATRSAMPSASLFTALRRALVGVEPVTLTRRGMLALSRTIEDEAATRADGGIVIGAFEQARFWRATAARWSALAGRSDAVVVLAVLPRSRARGRVWEVPLAPDAAAAREWAVVCDAPGFAACLVGLERPPDPARRSPRSFEALWSVEPAAVRATARAAARLAGPAPSPELQRALDRLEEPAVAGYDSLRSATVLTNRLLTHLDRWAGPEP